MTKSLPHLNGEHISREELDVTSIIETLRDSPAPDRQIDAAIAQLMGYQKTERERQVGNVLRPFVTWVDPKGEPVAKIPYYTQWIDHALLLANEVSPDHVGGCSWEKGTGSAKIDDSPYCQAVTPAMALCMAALTIMRRNSRALQQ